MLVLPKQPVADKKRRNVYYYLMLALLQFRNKFGRDPEDASSDVESLKKITAEILDLYQVSADKLSDEVFGLIYGEIVSVCSVVGGVISQEVIKAVSHKEIPINNVFLFDPFTYRGVEETVGKLTKGGASK